MTDWSNPVGDIYGPEVQTNYETKTNYSSFFLETTNYTKTNYSKIWKITDISILQKTSRK